MEVAPNADPDRIKQQYRFLVQAYHPDKFRSQEQKARAEEKLKQINEAYAVLSDPLERASYDRQRLNAARNGSPAWEEPARPAPPPNPRKPPKSPAELAKTNDQLGTGCVLIYIVVAAVLFIALRGLLRSVWVVLAILILAAVITLPLVYKLDDTLREK